MMDDAFILIVEDNPDDAALIQAVFDVSLVHVKTQLVVSGLEALSYLAGQSPYEDRQQYPLPSLIVLDLGLPDSFGFEGGFEVLAWLAEREGVSSIPVIVFTASDNPEHGPRAYALGARHFMRKVDDYGNLTKAVKEELHRWIATQRRDTADEIGEGENLPAALPPSGEKEDEGIMAPNDERFILIVEDDPDQAALIRAAFKKSLAQSKTHFVFNGQEAQAYLNRESPHHDWEQYPTPSLIVLDLWLPDITGFEILEWMA